MCHHFLEQAKVEVQNVAMTMWYKYVSKKSFYFHPQYILKIEEIRMPTNKKKSRNRRKNRTNENSTTSLRSRNQQQPPPPAIMEDDIPDDVFEEFLKWSFSDKEDINAKKFSKKAPLAAEWLLEGDASNKADRLQDKRKVRLVELEKESKNIDENSPRDILVDSMSEFFKSEGEKFDFGQQLDATIKRKEKQCLPPFLLLSNAFDKLAGKWAKLRGISLDSHRYYHKALNEFIDHLQEDEDKMLEKKSGLFQRYQEIRKNHPLHSTTYMDHEVGTTLFTYTGGFQHRDKCWECEKEYVSQCSGCQCAKYCSKACQRKHWKSGHKDKCKDIGSIWSMHLSNKKRVEKAMKDKRISTTCNLPPSSSIDIQLLFINTFGMSMSSMDTFYSNMANLLDGGKHPIFGEQTVDPKLIISLNLLGSDTGVVVDSTLLTPNMIHTTLLDHSFEGQPIKQNEIDALIVYGSHLIKDVPSHEESYWKEKIQFLHNKANLTIEKFLTLYALFDPMEMYYKGLIRDKYLGEFMLLTNLKSK